MAVQDSPEAPRQDPCAVLPHRRCGLPHQARRSRDRGDRQVPPHRGASFIEVDSARALYWLGVGAQPSPQVEAILKLTGDWGTFKGDKNAKSTVKTKEPKAEFSIDEKKKPVLKPKAEKAPKAEAAPAAEAAAEEAAVAEEAPAAEARSPRLRKLPPRPRSPTALPRRLPPRGRGRGRPRRRRDRSAGRVLTCWHPRSSTWSRGSSITLTRCRSSRVRRSAATCSRCGCTRTTSVA